MQTSTLVMSSKKGSRQRRRQNTMCLFLALPTHTPSPPSFPKECQNKSLKWVCSLYLQGGAQQREQNSSSWSWSGSTSPLNQMCHGRSLCFSGHNNIPDRLWPNQVSLFIIPPLPKFGITLFGGPWFLFFVCIVFVLSGSSWRCCAGLSYLSRYTLHLSCA